jgi:predicted sugar kinase
MIKDKLEFDLGQWIKLSDNERIKIINHYWDPYNQKIGQKTKTEIVDDFMLKNKITARQVGIASFGWTVYMLFVVVDNSRQRVPSNFLGLLVNKGVITSMNADNTTTVKFKYGGKLAMDLANNIVIK